MGDGVRFIFAYVILGGFVSSGIMALRRVGELPPMAWPEVIATTLLWPIAIVSRLLARRIPSMTLERYENLVLDRALREGTSITQQREKLGGFAPAHEFSLNRSGDFRCSICKRPVNKHRSPL